MSMEQLALKPIIRKYLGIPYRHGGRDLNGLDCLGLIHLFYRYCGITVPDGDGKAYDTQWVLDDPERYLRGLQQVGREVPLYDLKPLDLVYFRLLGYISHGGIMVDPYRFIHVMQHQRVHLTPLTAPWRRRLAGARRLL